jgi:hypothetical protein
MVDNGMSKVEASEFLEKTHVSAIFNLLADHDNSQDLTPSVLKEFDDDFLSLRSIMTPLNASHIEGS